MFDKILIANRGEIALRILRACKELGIATVAVHSTADADAMHVRLADESVCIGPPPSKDSYLNVPALLSACEITGVDAVHPGYGFSVGERPLCRDPRRAQSAFHRAEGRTHPSDGRQNRGQEDREEARHSVVPGSEGASGLTTTRWRSRSTIGFPVLVKAASGGGGRGMKVAQTPEDLTLAPLRPRQRSQIGIRRCVGLSGKISPEAAPYRTPGARRRPRRRDPSRRARLLAAAAPSKGLGGRPLACARAAARARSARPCAKAMQDMKYLGVGTVEFLYEDGEFYFIEMNTRIQVEHPVTEMITDIDLVLEQIRIAAGGDLPLTQEELMINGHSIECRVNAENPHHLPPLAGQDPQYHPPGGLGVRIDSAVYQGYVIPPYYDSLVGKLIVHGKTRGECLMRLRRALDEMVVEGIETTLPLFRALVREPAIIDGDYHIHWLEQYLAGQSGASRPLHARKGIVGWNQLAEQAFRTAGDSCPTSGALHSVAS
jgi:acetyl-CoA carboxylase biotin carboxylase subunit